LTYLLDAFIEGLPAPQGSKRLMGRVMLESSKKVQPWRQDIKHQVSNNYGGPVIDLAVFIEIEFLFYRPKSHYNTKGILRPSAPAHLVSRGHGDLDKLLRSTFDALSISTGGTVIADDSLIVRVAGSKRYCLAGERCGASIRIGAYSC
jgi:crossover junction endodeoxyribonuclease RusA